MPCVRFIAAAFRRALNLPSAALYGFEDVVPDLLPARGLILLELALLVPLPDLPDQGVEHIVHVPPGRRDCF